MKAHLDFVSASKGFFRHWLDNFMDELETRRSLMEKSEKTGGIKITRKVEESKGFRTFVTLKH